MSVKKIVFVLGSHLPSPGAGWRRIEYFARYLSCKGFRVYILGSIFPAYVLSILRNNKRYRSSMHRKSYLIMNIQLYMRPIHASLRILNMVTALFLTFSIIALRPKVVIVSVPNIEQVWASYVGARLVGAKFIVDIRDPAEDYAIINSRRLTKRLCIFIKRFNFAIASLSFSTSFSSHFH